MLVLKEELRLRGRNIVVAIQKLVDARIKIIGTLGLDPLVQDSKNSISSFLERPGNVLNAGYAFING